MLLFISFLLMGLFPLRKEVKDFGIEWLTLILDNLTTIRWMVVCMLLKEVLWYVEIMALFLKWKYKQWWIGLLV